MIPKIIHYCWFGKSEKPSQVQKYIEGWKDKLPGFQIIEWNEDNFPIDYCKYTIEAYNCKKYAFVSDVARLYALYTLGGVYLDTDVEVLQDFSSELEASEIFSFESKSLLMTGFIAADQGSTLIKELLDDYVHRIFVKKDGTYDMTTNTVYVTNCLKKYGVVINGEPQVIGTCHIYNHRVFGAFDADNSTFEVDDNTYLIHHCMATWGTNGFKLQLKMKKFAASLFNGIPYRFIRRIIKKL